jgi:solute carrier family 35 protein C2
MCKSSSLVFVLLFAFLFRLETPSWRLVGIILVITAGVVLMVSTETQFNATGMIEVLTASALGGLRWSLLQILLEKESMGMSNPFATLFWLAPVMGLTLATCSIIFDGWGNVFGNEIFFGTLGRTMNTMGAIMLPGLLAFCMNVTEFGLLQRTSVVTL